VTDAMQTLMVAGPRELGAQAFAVSLSIDNFFRSLPDKCRVIHGSARGVDSICAEAATRHGHDVIPYPVNELDRAIAVRQHGNTRKAPLYRTIRMLESDRPDFVQVWWDGESRGTGFTITNVRKHRIPYNVMLIKDIVTKEVR
jgi:hypothetical protein